jgi:hypothetical protein
MTVKTTGRSMTKKLLKTYVGNHVSLQTTRCGRVDDYNGFLEYKNNRFYVCSDYFIPFFTLETLIDYKTVTFICVLTEEKR